MSADLLRRAAFRARRHGTAHPVLGADFNDPRHLAVADWLDATANSAPEFNDPLLAGLIRLGDEQPSERTRAALAVARAYLGEDA